MWFAIIELPHLAFAVAGLANRSCSIPDTTKSMTFCIKIAGNGEPPGLGQDSKRRDLSCI